MYGGNLSLVIGISINLSAKNMVETGPHIPICSGSPEIRKEM